MAAGGRERVNVSSDADSDSIRDACNYLRSASDILQRSVAIQEAPYACHMDVHRDRDRAQSQARQLSTASPRDDARTASGVSPPLDLSSTIRDEMRRTFGRRRYGEVSRSFSSTRRCGTRRRGAVRHGQGNSNLSLSRPTWSHVWIALASTDQHWSPGPEDKRLLIKAGLGERKLRMPIGMDSAEVVKFLVEAYPKLEFAGGFEICRVSRGSRSLTVMTCLPEGYSQQYIAFEAGQARLFIRPVQHDLDVTPILKPNEVVESIEAINNTPTVACSTCGIHVPYSTIREHIDGCAGLKNNDLDCDDLNTSTHNDNFPNSYAPLSTQSNDSSAALTPSNSSTPPRVPSSNSTHPVAPCTVNILIPSVAPSSDSTPASVWNDNMSTSAPSNISTSSAGLLSIMDKCYSEIVTDEEQTDESAEDEIIHGEGIITNQYTRVTLEYAKAVLEYHVEQLGLKYVYNSYAENQYQNINIVRRNLWKTGARSISKSDFDPKHPFRVRFVGESGLDEGGPRREFLRLLMKTIQETGVMEGSGNNLCFSHDIQLFAQNRYYLVGKMVALSLSHGGPGLYCLAKPVYQYLVSGNVKHVEADDIPDYEVRQLAKKIQDCNSDEDMRNALELLGDHVIAVSGYTTVEEVTLKERELIIKNLGVHYCVHRSLSEIEQFRDGLNTLQIADLITKEPGSMEYFLCANKSMKPTVSYIKDMTVDYSPEGSNDRILEETTIYNWYEYLDDCAKGEVKANFNDGNENAEVSVQISLGDLLTFFTGVASVPPLGLHPEPSISFLRDKDHIFPTANTCANILSLPLGLIDVEVFGERFTYALTNSMEFGVV